MLIDTHCHLNIMVKKDFDTVLEKQELYAAQAIINEAAQAHVTIIVNVGTSLIESINSIELAQAYSGVYATIGIHPNDATEFWPDDLAELSSFLISTTKSKIVAIGECGIDRHYPDYNLERQQDVFRAQIELALRYDLALVIHTRNAGDATLRILQEFKHPNLRGTIHCFSEDEHFAHQAIDLGFVLGIGGIITYPKNTILHETIKKVGLDHIVLETDSPYLPPQIIRGKQNSPRYIHYIANYIAELLGTDFDTVARTTTANAQRIFGLPYRT